MKSWKDTKATTTATETETSTLHVRQTVPVVPTVLTSFDSSWEDANWGTPELEARDNSFIVWDEEIKIGGTFCGLLVGMEDGKYGKPNIVLQDRNGNIRKTTLSTGMQDYENTITEMVNSHRKNIMIMFMYEKSVPTKNGKNCRLFKLKFREAAPTA